VGYSKRLAALLFTKILQRRATAGGKHRDGFQKPTKVSLGGFLISVYGAGDMPSLMLSDNPESSYVSTLSESRSLNVVDADMRYEDVLKLAEKCRHGCTAKVTGSDVAVSVASEALQIAGLEASLHRVELEKIFRDAKLTQIYEGTNQLNRHNLFVNTFGGEADHGAR